MQLCSFHDVSILMRIKLCCSIWRLQPFIHSLEDLAKLTSVICIFSFQEEHFNTEMKQTRQFIIVYFLILHKLGQIQQQKCRSEFPSIPVMQIHEIMMIPVLQVSKKFFSKHINSPLPTSEMNEIISCHGSPHLKYSCVHQQTPSLPFMP